MARKLTPNDPKFWMILQWYYIYDLIEYYLRYEASFYESPEDISPADITDMLEQVYPQICPEGKRWLNGTELLSVWLYEQKHPEIGDRVRQYIKDQKIPSGW